MLDHWSGAFGGASAVAGTLGRIGVVVLDWGDAGRRLSLPLVCDRSWREPRILGARASERWTEGAANPRGHAGHDVDVRGSHLGSVAGGVLPFTEGRRCGPRSRIQRKTESKRCAFK